MKAIKTAEQLLRDGKELGRLEYIEEAATLIEPYVDNPPNDIPKAKFFELYGDCHYAKYELLADQAAIDALDRALIFREQAFYASAESPETGPQYLHTWAFNLREHFKASGDIQQLFLSITAFKSAVDLALQCRTDPSLHLANLSDACREFCDFHFDDEIRSTGIDSARRALLLVDQDHPYRTNISFTLATLLSHEISSKDERLEGISLFESKLRNLPPTSPVFRLALCELINSLICQYEVVRNEDYLIAADKCVAYLHRQSENLLYPDTGYALGRVLTAAHKITGNSDARKKASALLTPLLRLDLPNRLRWNAARCLATCLKSAYMDDFGNIELLKAALSAAEVAQDAMKSIAFGRGEDLDDWLFLCQEAYERLGSLHYLEHGVATGTKLIAGQHQSGSNLSPELFEQVGCLFALRYQRFRRLDDIDHAALAFRAALGASQDGTDAKSLALTRHNLGLAIKDKGFHLKLASLIEDGIEHMREATSSAPDTDSYRSKYRLELGWALIKLGELTGEQSRLSEGLKFIDDAASYLIDNDPDIPKYRMFQAAALEIQSELASDFSLLETAILLVAETLRSITPDHAEYLEWQLNYAYLLEKASRCNPDKFPIKNAVATFERVRLAAAIRLRHGLLERSTSNVLNASVDHLIALNTAADDVDAIIGLIEDSTGFLHNNRKSGDVESTTSNATLADENLFARSVGISMGNTAFRTTHDEYVGFGSSDAEVYRDAENALRHNANHELDYRQLGSVIRGDLCRLARSYDACFVYLIPNKEIDHVTAIVVHPNRAESNSVKRIQIASCSLREIFRLAFGSLGHEGELKGNDAIEALKTFDENSTQHAGFIGTRYLCRLADKTTSSLGVRWQVAIEIALKELGQHLMQPLADLLSELGCRKVAICGLGMLSSMPLHAATLTNGRAFCEVFETTIASNASSHIRASRNSQDADSEVNYAAVVNADGTLPMAELAAIKIATQYHSRSKIVCGSAATEGALKQSCSSANLVHISCHAAVTPLAPFSSRLLLGLTQEGSQNSLSVGQLFGGELPIAKGCTVVLDCCDTSLPDNPVSINEQPSFVTGFLSIGARTVVGAWWEIDDFCTALLIGFAFEGRSIGQSWSNALASSAGKLKELTAAELTAMIQHDLALIRRLINEHSAESVSDEAFQQSYAIQDKLLMLLARMKSLPAETRPFAHPYYWAGLSVFGMW